MNKKDNISQPHGLYLNAKGERVDFPLDGLPEWMAEMFSVPSWFEEALADDEDDEEEDDDDMHCVIVVPYRGNEFRQWLIDRRGIKEKTADDYLRAYESGYDSLYEEVGEDLYDFLELIFDKTPEAAEYDLTKEDAPGLVELYIDVMEIRMMEDKDSYTNAQLRALKSYHDFIAELAGTKDKTYLKKKSTPLPDEEEFMTWLEKEYRMDYENVRKIVSSVKRMDMTLPSMVSDPMTFLDVLRAIPINSKRENYVNLVEGYKSRIYKRSHLGYKTIDNGFGNIRYYSKFLSSKNLNH